MAHEDRRPALYRSIWLDEDGRTVVVIDQTRLPHNFETRRLRNGRGGRTRHQHDGGAGRAAYRRDGGLRHGSRARRGPERFEPGERHHAPGRHAADRGQPALGAGGSRPPAAALACRGPRCRCLPEGGRRSATKTSPSTGRSGKTASRWWKRRQKAEDGPVQRADPLQRRLARHGRLGHGIGAALHGPRQGHPGPRLGRRNAGRATRALRSRRGSWRATGCRTR